MTEAAQHQQAAVLVGADLAQRNLGAEEGAACRSGRLAGPVIDRGPGSITSRVRSVMSGFRGGVPRFNPSNRGPAAFLLARCTVHWMSPFAGSISCTSWPCSSYPKRRKRAAWRFTRWLPSL